MKLDQYGYKPTRKAKARRRGLKQAIQDTNFDAVYDRLEERLENLEENGVKKEYRRDRLSWDLNWLKKRSNRYYTDKF